MRLGIDFGTTRTVVSAVDPGGYPVVRFEMDGEVVDHLPGLAAATATGLAFGAHARRVVGTPESTWGVVSVKRLLGQSAPDDEVEGLAGTSVLALTTAYLSWLRSMLTEHSNIADRLPAGPLEAMVAVPAQAGARQRYITLEAFRRAGFSVLGILGEPTAAAIEYAVGNVTSVSPRSPKHYLVVYDMGGGTFDTAAVSLKGRRYELLACEGIGRLGGFDFDRLILDHALRAAGLPEASSFSPVTRLAMLERAREAKEALRPKSRKMLVDLAGAGGQLPSVTLDVDEIYAASLPLMEPSMTMVTRLLERIAAGGIDTADPRKLAALYLVGGSSAYVPLARALRARFGRKILLAPQPHAATAIGLAVAANPTADVFVREAITRFFGVWREADAGRDKVFDAILSKETLPEPGAAVVVERRYRPAHRVGHLRFLECTALTDEGQPAGDLTPWEEVRFPYDPALRDGELDGRPAERRCGELDEEIVETYTHAPDGTIEVAIENRTRGYRRRYALGALR
ncbi:MAG: Hsp70 family protein [Myxococcota bacterium]